MKKSSSYLYIINTNDKYTIDEINEKLKRYDYLNNYASIFITNYTKISFVFNHKLSYAQERNLLLCLT
jgi:hypothetical protein